MKYKLIFPLLLLFLTACKQQSAEDIMITAMKETEINELKQEITNLRALNTKIEEESFNLKSLTDIYENDINQLQEENSTLSEQLHKLNTEIDALNQEIEEFEPYIINENYLDITDIDIWSIKSTPNDEYAILEVLLDGVEKSTLYLYNRKERKITNLNLDRASDVYWSPDFNYFFTAQHTSFIGGGKIFDAATASCIKHFCYMGQTYWLNEYEFIYSTENEDIHVNADLESSYTFDIVKFNIQTGEETVLFPGTADYFCLLGDVTETGFTVYKNSVYEHTHETEFIEWTK